MYTALRMAVEDWRVLRGGRTTRTYDYAFLVHPRDVEDVYRKYGFLRYVSTALTKRILRHLWPVRVAPIRGLEDMQGAPLRGVVIACPPLASQLLHDRAYARHCIVRASQLAHLYGARAVGLGALTASLSRGGLDVQDEFPNLRVVTGRLYTVHNISELCRRACAALGEELANQHVAVVGAAGSIGAGSAQRLAHMGVHRFTLIDHADKMDDVKTVASAVQRIAPTVEVRISGDLSTLYECDIVVTATNRPDALVRSSHIRSGTVIVDDAQPSDVEDALFRRDNVMVLEGGAVHSESISVPFDFGLKYPNDVFSCMAELLVVAASGGAIETPIGRTVDVEQCDIDRLARAAEQLRLRAADFQNMCRTYTDDDVRKIRALRTRRL